MKRVGITGVMGSGKSTFCRLLSAYSGAPVFDCDKEAKELMVASKSVYNGVREIFGDSAYRMGELDRKYVADRIFENPILRGRLNAVVHPAVIGEFERWCAKQHTPYVIAESALLFDSELEEHVDLKIMIDASEELRIERCMLRDGATREQIEARFRNQMSPEQMRRHADRVVQNDRDSILSLSVPKIDAFIKMILECPR